MNDPIGDFIIRLKNASQAKKASLVVPFSKIKWAIAELLLEKGYVADIAKKNIANNPRYIEIKLLYGKDGKPFITGVRRISKPSRRLYAKSKDIIRFRKGFGFSVFSTPKGIMDDSSAKKNNLGGEFLFNIW